jgi:ABC-type polysaccharide/polyol phosphate export permease
MNTRKLTVLNDLKETILGSDLLLYLAWQEVKQKYRRSFLGPFWVTLSTGILITAMGPLYSLLFSQPLVVYFKYFACSYIIWIFFASYLNDVSVAFITNEPFIKQMSLPYASYIVKVILRNIIIFFHNILIIFIISLFILPVDFIEVLYLIPGFFLVMINLFWLGLLLAIASVRYRDVPQMLTSFLQLLYQYLADWNFIFHMLEIIRAPMLGKSVYPLSWVICGVGAIIGTTFTLYIFANMRHKISYWI